MRYVLCIGRVVDRDNVEFSSLDLADGPPWLEELEWAWQGYLEIRSGLRPISREESGVVYTLDLLRVDQAGPKTVVRSTFIDGVERRGPDFRKLALNSVGYVGGVA